MNRMINERSADTYDDEIDLLELWNVIWRRRKFITIFSAAAVSLTVIISLLMTNIYRAESTLLPVSAGGGNMMGELAGMAALAGISLGSGGDTSTKVMVVANSRTVKEKVIRDMGLTEIIVNDIPGKRDPMQYTLEEFDKLFSVTSDKRTGLITIGFEWEDPAVAAGVVNSHIEALQEILESKALSVERKRREFFEKKLDEERRKFRGKKQNLASFQKQNKIMEPAEQARGTMTLYSALMTQKMTLEMQMEALESALTADNPRLAAVRNQVNAINSRIRSLEGNKNEGALLSMGNAPDMMVEYTDIMEGLKTSQGVYETLAKLYEKAKLDEAKSDIYVEVIDQAIPPDKKIKPKRALMVLVAGMTSLFMAVFIVFFMEWLENAKGKAGTMRRN